MTATTQPSAIVGHTPLPWVANCSHIYAPDGAIIATVSNPGSKESDYPLVANRDHIIRAVNNHHDLVEALDHLCASIEAENAAGIGVSGALMSDMRESRATLSRVRSGGAK